MFLTTAAVSAAKINAKVRSADISFHYSSAVSNGTADSTLAETDFEVRRLNHT